MKFPGSRFELDDVQIAEWQSIYPNLAVAREVRKAWAWLDANPARRKKNVKRFLVNWLKRGRLRDFAWWCIPVGAAVVVWQVLELLLPPPGIA